MQKKTAQLIIVFNTVVYVLLLLMTSMVSPDSRRLRVVGWIYATFSVCAYASPLKVMRRVITTESVESLPPFPLSLCLTLSAIVWLIYALFIHDYFVAAPNILGLPFGVAQIILFFMYRNSPSSIASAAARSEEDAPPSSSEMQDVVTATHETLIHELYAVAGEILEMMETMRNRMENINADNVINNNIHDEDDTEAPPEGHELEEVQTGSHAIVMQEIHLNVMEEKAHVAEGTLPENAAVIDIEGAPIELSVENV